MFFSLIFVFLYASSFFSFYFRFVVKTMSSRAVQGTEHPPLLLIIVQGAECPGAFWLTVVLATVDVRSQIDRQKYSYAEYFTESIIDKRHPFLFFFLYVMDSKQRMCVSTLLKKGK